MMAKWSICIILCSVFSHQYITIAFSISRVVACLTKTSNRGGHTGNRQDAAAPVVACNARQPSSSSGGGIVINGDSNLTSLGHESTTTTPKLIVHHDLKEELVLPAAPALSFRKFLTMQERRVVVTIRYAENAGWKPYYLTATKKIKARHPDVLLEKRVLPPTVEGGEKFEVAVDGKVIIGHQAKTTTSSRYVYCNMVELDLAISRARRRHRPSTTYGIVTNVDSSGKGTDHPPKKHKW